MGWKSTLRALEAQGRRAQREAQKRQRELERRAKEQEKLSAIEQARLEVETCENRLEVLLSVHKECGEVRDWNLMASTLPPPPPAKHRYNELRAKQRIAVDFDRVTATRNEAALEEAQSRDEQEYQDAQLLYSQEYAIWEKRTSLARRVISGEHKAYTEALVEFNPLAEISDLGSSIHFTVHNPTVLECTIRVNGVHAIPSEVKSVTASGKLSVNAMPKNRFHEIYQDYVCGCVLRVAREVFALLPIETVLVTASAEVFESSTGKTVERAVLSVSSERAAFQELAFDALDPSDAVESFLHRGDFKASRKSGAFQPIIPLKPADIPASVDRNRNCEQLLSSVRRLHDELRSELVMLRSRSPGVST
jgi:hypothetical protein